MKWLVDNWTLLVVLISAVIVGLMYARRFAQLPSQQQIAKVKALLLLWVTQAEKELGRNTGVLKLRWVYQKFIDTFPAIAPVVPFELFASWVDEALEQMKHLLDTNNQIFYFVEGDNDGE